MERDTQLSSNKLFHYTYSLENLINILKTGFQVQYSLESINFVSTQETNLQHEIAIPMICFCDIPLKLVKQHTAVYGNYAIGLAKEWGVGESVCPVLYLPEHGETTVIFEQIAENIQKNVSAIKRIKEIVPLEYKSTLIDVSNLYDNLVDLIMFVKPYIGSYERKFNGFKDNNYKFYDEREWRYKPNKMLCRSFLTKQEYESFENPEERNSNLSVITFDSEHVLQILVPTAEIKEVKEEITKIDKFRNFDLEIITSIDKI